MVPKTTPVATPPKKAVPAKYTDEQWKDKYFGWHPDADKDGELTWAEYKVHKDALDAKKAETK